MVRWLKKRESGGCAVGNLGGKKREKGTGKRIKIEGGKWGKVEGEKRGENQE
jgi:hypothetical protein